MLRRLLQTNDAASHPNACTTNGTTMLMLSCFGGHREAAAALLDHGADLAATNAWDCDAGHFAAMGGHVAMCAADRLCAQALPASQSSQSKNWLHCRCEWLSNRGVRLDRRQRSGHTALHKAADAGREAVVRHLLTALTAAELRAVGECSAEEQAAAAEEGEEGEGAPGRPSQSAVVSPDGEALSATQLAARREAHLPSRLAHNRGHAVCEALLIEAGL